MTDTDILSALQEALKGLQQLLQDRSNRAEAKTWLFSALAQLEHISPAARWACFHPCNTRTAPSSSSVTAAAAAQQQSSPVASCRQAELHLLSLLSELAPADISALLVRDPEWLCAFLTASTDRIRGWFGGFGPTSIQHFKWGARALANYMLAERADAWRFLVWSGKHSQSPVAVAAKPHYFGELDVVASVRNLVRSCRGFWRSDELMRSCQAGDWLGLDREEVAKELLRLLHDQRSSRHRPLLQLLADFLAATSWSRLCHSLLPLLPDSGVLQVVHVLAQDVQASQQQQQQQRRHGRDVNGLLLLWCGKQASFERQAAVAAQSTEGCSAEEQQAVLLAAATPAAHVPCVSEPHLLLLGCLQAAQGAGADGWTLDQLLLANALTCHRSQLLVLLRQEEEGNTSHLIQLVVAATAAFSASSPAAAGDRTAGSNSSVGLPLQARAVAQAAQHSPRRQRPLLLLVAGWLLRLQTLLQLAGAADSMPVSPAAQQQQPQAQAALQLASGGRCHLLPQKPMPPAAAVCTDRLQQSPPASTQQQQQQEQEQEQQQEQKQQEEQEQQQQQEAHQQEAQRSAPSTQASLQPAKTPLRRGPGPAPRADAAARDGSSSSSSDGHRHKPGSKHKKHSKHKRRRSSKARHSSHNKRRLKRRRSTTSSSDEGDGERQVKHRHKRRRRHSRASSSSSDATGSDSEWAGLDLDAGGELLDAAAAFKLQQRSPAEEEPGGFGKRPVDSPTSAQQQQQVGSEGLEPSVVEGRLAELSVGGRLWQWPQALACLPVSCGCDSAAAGGGHGGHGDAAAEGGGSSGMKQGAVVLVGSLTEVADAAALVWLCGVVAQCCKMA